GAQILINNQLQGIQKAVEYGMTVKVNTVYIPGVNEGQFAEISHAVKKLGASVMNILPLIPQADFAHVQAPSAEQLEAVRKNNEKIIGQFKHCRQCRADAIGLIGQDVKFSRIGCDVTSEVNGR
ncbi:nitrogen fixation protein NifB, partial [bacterium]